MDKEDKLRKLRQRQYHNKINKSTTQANNEICKDCGLSWEEHEKYAQSLGYKDVNEHLLAMSKEKEKEQERKTFSIRNTFNKIKNKLSS